MSLTLYVHPVILGPIVIIFGFVLVKTIIELIP